MADHTNQVPIAKPASQLRRSERIKIKNEAKYNSAEKQDNTQLIDDNQGSCCFCREPCNPCSQCCGRCARGGYY